MGEAAQAEAGETTKDLYPPPDDSFWHEPAALMFNYIGQAPRANVALLNFVRHRLSKFVRSTVKGGGEYAGNKELLDRLVEHLKNLGHIEEFKDFQGKAKWRAKKRDGASTRPVTPIKAPEPVRKEPKRPRKERTAAVVEPRSDETEDVEEEKESTGEIELEELDEEDRVEDPDLENIGDEELERLTRPERAVMPLQTVKEKLLAARTKKDDNDATPVQEPVQAFPVQEPPKEAPTKEPRVEPKAKDREPAKKEEPAPALPSPPPKETTVEKEMVKNADAAAYLGVSTATLANWRDSKKIKGTKGTNGWEYTQEELDRVKEQREKQSEEDAGSPTPSPKKARPTAGLRRSQMGYKERIKVIIRAVNVPELNISAEQALDSIYELCGGDKVVED